MVSGTRSYVHVRWKTPLANSRVSYLGRSEDMLESVLVQAAVAGSAQVAEAEPQSDGAHDARAVVEVLLPLRGPLGAPDAADRFVLLARAQGQFAGRVVGGAGALHAVSSLRSMTHPDSVAEARGGAARHTRA